ncbi:Glut1 [Trypoxylus dichotomus]
MSSRILTRVALTFHAADSLQKQVSVMSMNLSAKLDELQRGDRHLETTVALCEIRSQLQELTKSVESCQSEVSEVKRDMVAIKHELDTVQQVKEEIEELREYVDRLEEHTHRRKLRLLEQVGGQLGYYTLLLLCIEA